ncbi:MAG: GNAT family N-acetyltransferase [Ktedonobacteraceae bacterium]
MDRAIQIRPFTIHDQTAARALILGGLGEHFGFIDETLNPDLDDITASYLASGHLFLVAEQQQTLVGTGALLLQPAATGQIVRVSTHPIYRRLGIARAICQQLIEHARQLGLHTLIVETNRNWHDALKLYQDLGFQQYTRDDVSSYLGMDLDK